MTKEDILRFFEEEYSKEECDKSCPFVEECNTILVTTQGKDTLCDLFGIASEKDAVITDEESEDDDDYF